MDIDASQPPAKRARLASDSMASSATSSPMIDDIQVQKEIKCGITAFVNPQTATFSGVLKQRYTDFLVNEISTNGKVLHLESLHALKPRPRSPNHSDEIPPPSEAVVDEEPQQTRVLGNVDSNEAQSQALNNPTSAEIESVQNILGEECADLTQKLYFAVLNAPQKKPRDFAAVFSAPIEDRQKRTEIHQLVRAVFRSKLETSTQDNNTIKLAPAPRHNPQQRGSARGTNDRSQLRGKLGWQELGGEFVHFTLYKENKDTMECIALLASQSKIHAKRFGFSGTKDRRAVTVQRASAFRVHAKELENFGKRLNGAKIGDFSHEPRGLELGQLQGNEFCVALRDCHFPGQEGLDVDGRLQLARATLSDAVPAFERDGFINYYGLQRFGSFQSSTDAIGMKILRGDLQGAVEDILQYSPEALAAVQDADSTAQVSSDDKNRSKGLHIWHTTKDATKALEHIPRKFNAETNLIRSLGSKNKARQNDYQGALMTIPRTLRLMYVHAYQSLVWNTVAAERWRAYGAQVVAGDLVIANSGTDGNTSDAEVDDAGELIVRPAGDDAASKPDEFTRARPLSQEEAESGQYSIFDIVLPLPGFDVEYPRNESGKVYETFMSSERGGGLDPYNMRRSWKDASLSGGYRPLIARPLFPMSWEVKTYGHEEEQLTETDLDRIKKQEREANGEQPVLIEADSNDSTEGPNSPIKIAVILKFSLGSSQYATMALRELLGAGNVRTFQPAFAAGR